MVVNELVVYGSNERNEQIARRAHIRRYDDAARETVHKEQVFAEIARMRASRRKVRCQDRSL